MLYKDLIFVRKSLFKAADMSLEEYYEDYQHATRDSQSKFSYHILSHLSDIYNFRFIKLVIYSNAFDQLDKDYLIKKYIVAYEPKNRHYGKKETRSALSNELL